MIYQITHNYKTIALPNFLNQTHHLFEDRELAMNALRYLADSDKQSFKQGYLTESYLCLEILLPIDNSHSFKGELIVIDDDIFIGQIINKDEPLIQNGEQCYIVRTFK